MSVLAAACLCGCAARGSIDVLESELRRQEDLLRQTQEQLQQAKSDLEVAHRESNALRKQLANRGDQPLLPEQADVLFRAEGIRFNSLLTNGIDRDGAPGDEKLSVLLYPHDREGGLLKLPGEIELKVVDLSAPADRQQLGQWTYTIEQCRELWHNGFLASGYLFELPWQQPPMSEEVTLHARFRTPDGREFDATQQVKVTPPGPSHTAERPGVEREYTARKPAFRSASTERAAEAGSSGPAFGTEPLPGSTDADPAAGNPFLPNDGQIDTSDRFREFEIPRYR